MFINNISKEIINKYGINLLIIFGSFAEGTVYKEIKHVSFTGII